MENGCVLVKENKFYYTKTVILVIIEKRPFQRWKGRFFTVYARCLRLHRTSAAVRSAASKNKKIDVLWYVAPMTNITSAYFSLLCAISCTNQPTRSCSASDKIAYAAALPKSMPGMDAQRPASRPHSTPNTT